MKKHLLLLILFAVFIRFEISAQEGNPCPVPAPPGNSCQASCVFCNFDGFMGNNGSAITGGPPVCNGAISIHNDQWFGFTAGTTSITIDVIVSNCLNNDGLQMAIFDDCTDPDAIVCDPGCDDCGSNVVSLSYDAFVPGATYWLMVDGWTGDQCDFEIDVTNGSVAAPAPDPASQPQGPTTVCPGATVVYTIPEAFGAGYYHWTAPGGSSINGGSNNVNVNAPEGNQVTVTFGSTGGNVCVQTGNSCFPQTPLQCLPVTNMPIPVTVKPPIVICNNELPYTWDEEPFPTLSSTGTFTLNSTPYDSYLGCDSVIRQIVTIKPPLMSSLPLKYLCEGTCFEYAGVPYCDPGPQTVVLPSYQMCDSVISFSISILAPHAQISGNSPITCATPGGLTLNATNYAAGSTFQWSNANWNILGGSPTQNVASTGVYHLVVTHSGGGVFCRDTTEVTVSGNTTPPGATVTGANINCISTTAALHGTSGTSGVTYLWTGPGITPANQNQQNPVVNVPGTYILTVTNPVNSCTSTGSYEVLADNTAPQATATSGDITCIQSSYTIDGTTNIANPTWNWSGPGINATNQNLEDPNVLLPGSYSVTVTNTVNGCSNTALATVNLNNNVPTAGAGADQTLTCLVPTVNLQGSGNTGAAPMGIAWSGPASFTATTLNPSVDAPGLYILTITNQQNGCFRSDSVEIASNQVLPTVNAGADSIITCDQPDVTLIGSASSTGANFTPQWTGPGINASNQNQYSPTVGVPGTYTLLITNGTSGCTATDVVEVTEDTNAPASNAGGDQLLTCTNQNGVTLSGSGTPAGITYLWSGPGIGANNETEQAPLVTQSGIYTLQVTNPVNGCTSTDQAEVTQDANVPSANGGLDHTLNCTVNSVDFDGSGSTSGAGITYSWTGPGISGANATAQSPTGITVPGTYNLVVTNSNNNCVNTDVVVVIEDIDLPTANAGSEVTLNCFNNAIDTLDASASSTGSIYTYLWTGPGIVAGQETLLHPVVNNEPGQYTLVVTNTENTCTSSAQVTVVSDQTAPTADAGADQVIDCVVLTTTIGGASSSGPNFSYLWTGPGITSANATLATPSVSQPGTYTIVVTDSSNGCTQSQDVVVNTNAVYPNALAGADGLLTCAVTTATLDGSSSSSGAGFNVLWTGPGITPATQSQPAPSVNVPGTYILSITDNSNSCISRDTVVIDQNIVVPAVSAGIDLLLDCQTTTVTLDGSSSATGTGITYLWSGGVTAGSETQQSPSVSQPGTYSLLVTDTANGCSDTDDVVVTQDIAAPTASAGADLLITCANTTQVIDGSGSSSGALFEYVWQGNGINTNNFSLQNPMVSDSGTYTVIVTNVQNHCTSTDIVYVNMDKQLPITAAGPDRTLTCALTSVQLDGSLSQAGPNISYLWSGPAIAAGETTIATPTVSASGSYNLTVTNSLNGCSNTDFVFVGQDIVEPAADAGGDLVITCANSTQGVTLSSAGSSSGPGFTYLWTGAGITSANETQANPNVLQAGTYTLVVTNTANGCTKSNSMEVSLDQDLPTASAGPNQTINCNITTVTLDATGSSSNGGTLGYTWAGPGITAVNVNSSTPNVTAAGIYTVTVLNSLSGCQASAQVEVILDNTPPTVTTTTDVITCQDLNGNLSVTSSQTGSTFLWSGPGINTSNQSLAAFTVTQAGNYSVTVTGTNGCSTSTSTVMGIDDDVPDGTAEGAVLNCLNGQQTTVNGQVTNPPGTTFSWSGPGIGTVNANSAAVTIPGTYTFTMSSPAGCVQEIEVEVLLDVNPPTVTATPTDLLDCSTTQVNINASGTSTGNNFVYQWTTSDGNIVSGANSLNPLVDQAGNYLFLVRNNLNGCSDSISVEVMNDPAVPTAFNVVVRNIVCFGDTDGAINVNGVVGGTAPFNFTLTDEAGNTTNQYTGLTAGEYTLALVDGNGCELDTTISIGEPGQLVVELGPDVQIELGAEATVSVEIQHSTPLQSVTWNYYEGCVDSNSVDGYCSTFTYTPLNSYRHTITVVDSNGCVARDQVLVIVNKPRNVYVPNIFNPDSSDPDNSAVRIYMGTDVLTVHKWLIFDRWGNAVYQVQDIMPGDTEHGWTGKVRGDDAQVGVYVWYALVEFIDGEVIEYKGDVTVLR